METFGDKARAYLFALLVHVLCIGALFAGLLWTEQEVHPIDLKGPVIDVELTGISAAPVPKAQRPKSIPKPVPPKPQPEAVKPPEPVPQSPTQVQQQDRIDREKVVQIANEKAEAERAEQEKHRQEQVQLEKEVKEERDRERQLEQIKKQREAAQKTLALEKQRLEQMRDLQNEKPVKAINQPVPAAEKPVSGNNGQDDSMQAQYWAAIQNAITNNWLRPDSAQAGLRCTIRIVQIPGGDVIGVQLGSPCNADPQTRTSIEQAVKRASPLPYKGFEKVFSRDFNLNFSYDG
jgi:colicin import membrane protein